MAPYSLAILLLEACCLQQGAAGEAPTLREKFRLEHKLVYPGVFFSSDGKVLAAASSGGTSAARGEWTAWEMSTGVETPPKNARTYLEFVMGRKVPIIPKYAGVLGFDPSGEKYWVYSRGLVQIRGAADGKVLGEYKFTATLSPHALSADGKLVAGVDVNQTIEIWDAESGETIARLKGHEKNVSHVAFSPCGKWLVSSARDKTVRVWNTKTGEAVQKHTFEAPAVGVAYSPDGKLIALALGGLQKVSILDAATGKELNALAFPRQPGATGASCTTVAFSPDGGLLASGGSGLIRVWEISPKAAPGKKK